VAESVDALDLESSEETRAGSIPVICTKKRKLRQYHNTIYYEC